MAIEIGNIYLLNDEDAELRFKNNFRHLTREEQLSALRKLSKNLDELGEFLHQHGEENAFDEFFRSLSHDDQKWRKQRGLPCPVKVNDHD